MSKFSYTVRDHQNRVLTGKMDAVSVDEVLDSLAQKEYTPVSVDELNFDGSRKGETFFDKINAGFSKMQNRVPYRSVVFFTRQLATMLDAGVPLAQALIQLAEDEKPLFKKIILQLEEDISMGNTFSDALARHPGAFNNMFVSVVRSGEVAGALDTVLDQMATYMENVEALKQKVRGAMRYPKFIAGFVFIMVVGILWKLVPVFASMYASFDAKLPLPTQILISASNIVKNNVLAVLGLAVLFVVVFKVALTQPGFQFFMHKYILKIPVYGLIIRKNIWATFSRTMSLLLQSGTPILQAVEICAAVAGNMVFSKKLQIVYDKLRTGEALSQTLKDSGVFPGLITQLVATGERAGRIDELLRKAAEFYEREIRITVESIASIIEPFLIIILGSIVGAILIALYMPVFNIGKLV
jgi:type IV pilus assembly protein PilC